MYIQDHTRDLTIGRGTLIHSLYILKKEDTLHSSNFCGSLIVDDRLWHHRLGHLSSAKLQHLSGILPMTKSTIHDHCEVCPLAKQKRLPFSSNNHLSENPFDLVHLDIWGPFSVESVDGFKYFLTIVDDCTRVTWVYMLRNKSEVTKIFPVFVKYVHTQYNSIIKAICSDNAPELAFTQLVKDTGMIHHFSCAYTPQQNSVVERKHQHLLNVARALLFQSNLPLVYWSECIQTAVFLINRTPSLILQKISPYEKLFKKKPDYNFLRSFGCLCYVSTLVKDRTKFTSRAEPCVFLGYPSGYKEVMNLNTNVISISRNVIFHETSFPFRNVPSNLPTEDLFHHTILPMSTLVALDTLPVHHTLPNHVSASSSASHSSATSVTPQIV